MGQDALDASSFSPDIRAFIEFLNKHQVRYLIVGGEAVIYFGYARLTGDVDFFYDREKGNTDNLFAALAAFWEGSIPGLAAPEELTQKGLVLQFGRPPNRIDLVNEIDAVPFEAAWPDRVVVRLQTGTESVPLYYIDLDHLIANKEAAARPKDLADVAFLTRTRDRRGTET